MRAQILILQTNFWNSQGLDIFDNPIRKFQFKVILQYELPVRLVNLVIELVVTELVNQQ